MEELGAQPIEELKEDETKMLNNNWCSKSARKNRDKSLESISIQSSQLLQNINWKAKKVIVVTIMNVC